METPISIYGWRSDHDDRSDVKLLEGCSESAELVAIWQRKHGSNMGIEVSNIGIWPTQNRDFNNQHTGCSKKNTRDLSIKNRDLYQRRIDMGYYGCAKTWLLQSKYSHS